jgi:NMT1-like family
LVVLGAIPCARALGGHGDLGGHRPHAPHPRTGHGDDAWVGMVSVGQQASRAWAQSDLGVPTVAVHVLGSHQHLFVASIAAYVGLDLRSDIHGVIHRGPEAMQLLAEGKIDGFMGFPPEPQEWRAKQIGHVVVETRADRPWSQYVCCMVAANRGFARARLKAADLYALEPMRAAHTKGAHV